MAHTRRAGSGDLGVLLDLERLGADELAAIVGLGRVLVAEHDDSVGLIGWLRWGMFWDEVPFMNHLRVAGSSPPANRAHVPALPPT